MHLKTEVFRTQSPRSLVRRMRDDTISVFSNTSGIPKGMQPTRPKKQPNFQYEPTNEPQFTEEIYSDNSCPPFEVGRPSIVQATQPVNVMDETNMSYECLSNDDSDKD